MGVGHVSQPGNSYRARRPVSGIYNAWFRDANLPGLYTPAERPLPMDRGRLHEASAPYSGAQVRTRIRRGSIAGIVHTCEVCFGAETITQTRFPDLRAAVAMLFTIGSEQVLPLRRIHFELCHHRRGRMCIRSVFSFAPGRTKLT